MEKVDLKGGEVITKAAAFHSKTEVNLASINSSELFSKMKETVLESLAKFQGQGNNGRFRSVLCLDLHTVKYESLDVPLIFRFQSFLQQRKRLSILKMRTTCVSGWISY